MTDRETRRLSFGSVATDYDRYRPGPPPQALDWLIPPGAQAVLALAAGTGAVARELVGRAARIGTAAILCPPLEIGEEALIGAGSFVRDDVAPRTVVVGTPARFLRTVRDDELI